MSSLANSESRASEDFSFSCRFIHLAIRLYLSLQNTSQRKSAVFAKAHFLLWHWQSCTEFGDISSLGDWVQRKRRTIWRRYQAIFLKFSKFAKLVSRNFINKREGCIFLKRKFVTVVINASIAMFQMLDFVVRLITIILFCSSIVRNSFSISKNCLHN